MRGLAAAGLAVLAGTAVTACEPGGGLTSASVAYTTDQVATAELGRRDVDVRWLTCAARYDDDAQARAASVDCEGATGDGRDITVSGQVSRAVDGSCVRGDLKAVLGDKQLFRVSGLGDCASATPSPVDPPRTGGNGNSGGGSSGGTSGGGGGKDDGGGARPEVTVTVTKTVWCDADGACGPSQRK
ncbi:hypothetical protein ACFWNK_08025 [Streptomyces sp. NPDC058417]|uniref:hypothetical protein n=1 Tax=unclassified Streptomyces TaxID=2593676 RepID=UPI00365BBAEB